MAYPIQEAPGQKRVVPTDQARQGESTGHVRYVLGGSLALAVIAGIILYMIYM
jgi:hypothetical protein